MAFKIVDEQFGQLTYTRIYQGKLKKGTQYTNTRTGKKQRVGRIDRCSRRYEFGSLGTAVQNDHQLTRFNPVTLTVWKGHD